MKDNFIGKEVKIYDGDLIGWTTGVVIEMIGENRAIIETKEGYRLQRHVFNSTELKKDGSGYIMNDL